MDTTIAKKEIAIYQASKSDRLIWDTRWQRIKEWFEPQNAQITEDVKTPTNTFRSQIHDAKGIEAAQVLTSAHMSYITPLNEDWLAYTAPRGVRNAAKKAGNLDAIESYFKEVSEIAMEEVTMSNFYSAIYCCYKDRSTIGTGCLLLKRSKKGGLNFQYIPAGTYCFREDEENVANWMGREYDLTLAQAVSSFGEERLGTKLKAILAQSHDKPELMNGLHKFLQVTKEREEYDPEMEDSSNMPYEDLNICMTDHVVVQEGGFEEFPYVISRYSKWDNHVWGYSPAMDALPNVVSSNYIRKILKTLGEVAAFPRILMLAGEKRNVDLRAGGMTTVSREAAQMGFPKEWGTQGRYDIGMALIEQDHASIEQFFHVDLFRMFSSIDKQMTATEVGAREREKLLMFAPSFTQFVTDMKPMMIRIFSMLAREQKLPSPPQELIQSTEGGKATIPTPEVVFQSKIALAIKSLQSEGFDRIMARAMPLMDVKPELADNWDWDQMFREMSRNEGMPDRWLKDKKMMNEMREARAQAQQEAAEAEEQAQAAQAIGAVGGAEGVQQLAQAAQ
ncbi:portal protein [Akkermansiaceae bacterium]|nr:portal protein [Akkermansiaceae bacterium]